MTSDESVENGIKEILSREGKLDIVVNNAGMICPGTDSTARESNSICIYLEQGITELLALFRTAYRYSSGRREEDF